MLPELMAANAAFAVIKQTVANSGDLLKAGKAISDFVNAKDTLQRKGNKKKHGLFRDPNQSSDIEEFMALETLRSKEEELKQYMIYCGRPGLWHDWIKFQGNARKERQKQIELAKRQREEIVQIIGIILVLCVGVLGIVWLIWFASVLKGM